ncbi:MAG: 3-keto-5-aminohexanoate cleavage protein [Proteobacteria bacterium]|nr:MAG: 3-keto-5-aminohexanoate cleavage protein [Pseudomonadota bacterium]
MTTRNSDADRPAVIIAAAPTGAHKSRADFPTLPVAADDIADEAYQCMRSGASMLHLHVRDRLGRHSLDAGLYREAVAAVRSRCGDGILIQATSEQAGVYDTRSQIEAIHAIEADFLSISITEILAEHTQADLNRAAELFAELSSSGTTVQVILYSAEQLEMWKSLKTRGLVPDKRTPLLFVLGRYHASRQSSPQDLTPFLEACPPADDPWMVCAFGAREIECMRFAVAQGGHVRVGFENNTLRPDGAGLSGTAESVRLTASALRADGFRIADVNDARRLLLR